MPGLQTIFLMNELEDASLPTHGWTIQRIRDITEAKFGKRPCWYQIKTALAIYEGKDVVGCALTLKVQARPCPFGYLS